MQTIVHPLLALGHLCEGGVMRPLMKKGGGSFVCTPCFGIKTRPTKEGGGVAKTLMASISAEAPPPPLHLGSVCAIANCPTARVDYLCSQCMPLAGLVCHCPTFVLILDAGCAFKFPPPLVFNPALGLAAQVALAAFFL